MSVRENRGFFLLFIALGFVWLNFALWVLAIFNFANYPTYLFLGSVFGAIGGFMWVICDITHFSKEERSTAVDLLFFVYGFLSLSIVLLLLTYL